MIAVVGPLELFFQSANASYEYFARIPAAYVSYHVHSHAEVPRHARTFESIVVVRMADGTAHVRHDDEAQAKELPPFPAPPTLDPVAVFNFRWMATLTGQNIRSQVANITPLYYAATVSRADVVVRLAKEYFVERAAMDSPGTIHLKLTPTQSLKSHAKMWLTDLYLDEATLVARAARYEQPTRNAMGKLDLRYGTFEGHWMLSELHYRVVGSVALVQVRLAYDAIMDGYEFFDNPLSAKF